MFNFFIINLQQPQIILIQKSILFFELALKKRICNHLKYTEAFEIWEYERMPLIMEIKKVIDTLQLKLFRKPCKLRVFLFQNFFQKNSNLIITDLKTTVLPTLNQVIPKVQN